VIFYTTFSCKQTSVAVNNQLTRYIPKEKKKDNKNSNNTYSYIFVKNKRARKKINYVHLHKASISFAYDGNAGPDLIILGIHKT